MTQTPTKTQFPDSSQSPWENPDNGLIYEWNGWGWDIVTPDEPEEPASGSAFTFSFEVCKEADFAGAEGKIFLELSSQKDDFSLPLQTCNLFRYSEKDVNGSTTPLLSEGWNVHLYAEDTSNNERGGATLGWRSVQTNDRETYGTVDNSINQSITRIDEGSIIQLIFTPSSDSTAVEISEGLPSRPWQEGDLYFDVTEDELTLYLYTGDDWVPAAPPVSLDGIESDITSLQEVASDVKKQLAYHTAEAQKADLKILDLEEGVADLTKKVDAIEVPEVEDLASLKKRISDLESKLSNYEKYEKAPAVVAWKWKGKASETYSKDMRWDNSKFLYISHVPAVGDCIKLDHKKWNEGTAHNINGGLLSFWVYRNSKWYQTAIFHICKYRLNYGGWFQFEYTWWTGQEPDADEVTYVSMSGMF
jgi:hypothetical protein